MLVGVKFWGTLLNPIQSYPPFEEYFIESLLCFRNSKMIWWLLLPSVNTNYSSPCLHSPGAPHNSFFVRFFLYLLMMSSSWVFLLLLHCPLHELSHDSFWSNHFVTCSHRIKLPSFIVYHKQWLLIRVINICLSFDIIRRILFFLHLLIMWSLVQYLAPCGWLVNICWKKWNHAWHWSWGTSR